MYQNDLDVMTEEFIHVNINSTKAEKSALIFINWWYIVSRCKSANIIQKLNQTDDDDDDDDER